MSACVVQDELAAEAAAAAEDELRYLQMEIEWQEWLCSNGLPERAHMLKVLEEAGLLGVAGCRGRAPKQRARTSRSGLARVSGGVGC
ncbi:hypothetical protein ACFWM0_09840 [Streptomyces sp. NPDC058405]|uniref:hypothetical protein n=1 Tax=Streptomyces sp. NPDC058405 TaxID=3346482 RepID=UPI0036665C52